MVNGEFIKCCICDCEMLENNALRVDCNFYCRECFNDSFYYCERCSEIIDTDNSFFYDDCPYCSDCINEVSFCCASCSHRVCIDDRNYDTDTDNYFCNDCFNEDDGIRLNEFKLPFQKIKSTTFKENPFKRFCGLEIETISPSYKECFKTDELLKYQFSQIYDGSLDRGGVEYPSNAFNGDLLFNSINAFCNELNHRKFKINSSCGLHIHLGVKKRDLEI